MAAVQVRYIVHDVDAAIAFYTRELGFKLVMHPAPAFAMLTRGELRLVLSAPNPSAGGGQSMPDGTRPAPGGWNRFAIEVSDLAATVDKLRHSGARFRNDIVAGSAASKFFSRTHQAIRSSCSSRPGRKRDSIRRVERYALFFPASRWPADRAWTGAAIFVTTAASLPAIVAGFAAACELLGAHRLPQ